MIIMIEYHVSFGKTPDASPEIDENEDLIVPELINFRGRYFIKPDDIKVSYFENDCRLLMYDWVNRNSCLQKEGEKLSDVERRVVGCSLKNISDHYNIELSCIHNMWATIITGSLCYELNNYIEIFYRGQLIPGFYTGLFFCIVYTGHEGYLFEPGNENISYRGLPLDYLTFEDILENRPDLKPYILALNPVSV